MSPSNLAFDNRLESHLNPAIHPKIEFQDGLLVFCGERIGSAERLFP